MAGAFAGRAKWPRRGPSVISVAPRGHCVAAISSPSSWVIGSEPPTRLDACVIPRHPIVSSKIFRGVTCSVRLASNGLHRSRPRRARASSCPCMSDRASDFAMVRRSCSLQCQSCGEALSSCALKGGWGSWVNLLRSVRRRESGGSFYWVMLGPSHRMMCTRSTWMRRHRIRRCANSLPSRAIHAPRGRDLCAST
jgi:hypothetical protein